MELDPGVLNGALKFREREQRLIATRPLKSRPPGLWEFIERGYKSTQCFIQYFNDLVSWSDKEFPPVVWPPVGPLKDPVRELFRRIDIEDFIHLDNLELIRDTRRGRELSRTDRGLAFCLPNL